MRSLGPSLPLLVLLLASACASLPTEVPGQPAVTMTPQPTPTVLPATPESVGAAPGGCPIPAGSPSLPDPNDVVATSFGLLAYLNAGGPLEALLLELEAGAWLPPRPQAVAEQDFDGDGTLDLALAVLEPSAQTSTPPGRLYVFLCSQGQYGLAYATPTAADIGGPLIHTASDLTGDGRPEILVEQTACGAHTCSVRLQILRWDGSAISQALDGTSEDLPTPTIELIGPKDSGAFDLAVTATGIASVGAGPFRPRTRIWSWEPSRQLFVVSAENLHSTSYRVHVLFDADQALRAGDYRTALDLYYRVTTDESLDEWMPGTNERQNLSAFALFHRILAYVKLNDLGDAQVVYGILQNSYPAGSPGRAYAELATAFWDTYQAKADLRAGCASARAYAELHASDVVDPLYFGYANPVYGVADICPPDL